MGSFIFMKFLLEENADIIFLNISKILKNGTLTKIFKNTFEIIKKLWNICNIFAIFLK